MVSDVAPWYPGQGFELQAEKEMLIELQCWEQLAQQAFVPGALFYLFFTCFRVTNPVAIVLQLHFLGTPGVHAGTRAGHDPR